MSVHPPVSPEEGEEEEKKKKNPTRRMSEKISYLKLLPKPVVTRRFGLKSDKKNRHFTCRLT
jgi:hypothetical protein